MKKRALITLFVLAALSLSTIAHAPSAIGFGFGTEQRSVKFSQENLPRLEEGNYAAWAVVNDKTILIGQFNVSTKGKLVDLSGKETNTFKSGQNLAGAEQIFVTIEEKKVNGNGPSATRILAGSVDQQSASLKFPIDYSKSKGTCIVAVMAAPIRESAVPLKNGVWFVRLAGDSIEKGLEIPNAPKGWYYEGWLSKGENKALRMGLFTKSDEADDFNGYSPSVPPPNFPGENFLQNAPSGYEFPLDVSGSDVWIALEPKVDTGDSPFPMKLFEKQLPDDVEARRNIEMDNKSDELPTMKATLEQE
ncbi:MAG: hypothetical protein ACYC1U_09610 [Candidatus Aquicultorales bacterium]